MHVDDFLDDSFNFINVSDTDSFEEYNCEPEQQYGLFLRVSALCDSLEGSFVDENGSVQQQRDLLTLGTAWSGKLRIDHVKLGSERLIEPILTFVRTPAEANFNSPARNRSAQDRDGVPSSSRTDTGSEEEAAPQLKMHLRVLEAEELIMRPTLEKKRLTIGDTDFLQELQVEVDGGVSFTYPHNSAEVIGLLDRLLLTFTLEPLLSEQVKRESTRKLEMGSTYATGPSLMQSLQQV
ncbi:MAG: hypothetical protein MHM6MM_000383 [Cercozoa sp. M6MM]